MALGRPEETALIQSLYSAANQSGGDTWPAFLERLANHTRSDFAALVIRDGEQKIVSVSAENGEKIAHALFDEDDTYGLNRLRNGRTYSQDDLPGALLNGGKMLRVARTQTTHGHIWLLVFRERDDFRAIDSSLLSGLMPHIATAGDIWAELGRNRLDSVLNKRITQALNADWVAFDHSGRVVDASAGQFAIQQLEAARVAAETNTPLAVTIGSDQEAEIFLVPFSPNFATRENAIACVGFTRTPSSSTDINPSHLAQALDIATSEARLAASLAKGLTIAESAKELGLTIETARNYSKQIYAKTGAKGQADLVRRVLNGVSMFGQKAL